jgi:hypothetical protein
VVTVRFSPLVAGVANGDLEIASDDPDTPLVTVPLTGEGITAAPLEFRLNCAGLDFTDSGGNLFGADKAFVAGDFGFVGSDLARTFGSPIAGTIDDQLYQDLRGGLSTFSYVFDSLPAGDYDVTLHFMEPSFPGPGSRIMDIDAEGILVIDDLDLFAASGATLTAHTETFTVNVTDGQLNIDITPVTANRAIVSAVEVVQAAGSSALFQDITAQVGIAPNHDVDTTLCGPPLGAGSAWADYDNDGDPDLFVTNSALGPHFLYRNDGDTNSDGLPDFTDVAVALGVDDPAAIGHSAVFIDYDNDGDQDLYVTAVGGNTLWENQLVESGNLAVSFIDVTIGAGLVDFGRGLTTAWGDFNGDSFLDMYVTKHFDCIGVFPSLSDDHLYMNNGDGTFSDVTDYLCGAGASPCTQTLGYGFAPGWVDYDGDDDLDLYLANDFLPQPANYPNVLWRNDGTDGSGGWLFSDVSAAAGADIAVNSMGLGIGDYDNDGFFDFAFSNIGNNTLLHNEGDGTFTDVSVGAGVQRGTTPLGDTAITWGTVFFDYNNDTDLDLYIAAGEIAWASLIQQPNALFHNNGNGTFTDIAAGNGLEDPTGHGRNASIVDVDGDGYVDLMTCDFLDDRNFYHNRGAQLGNTNHWLTITVEGTTSNRDGIGTVITVDTPDGTSQMRLISSGPTHGGGDYRAGYFGLGTNATADVTIKWPTGVVQVIGAVAIDQALHFVEP